MGSGMPEIGSRISLISKADIRYEGKLFSVDPEECTIALSSVRSYGTEDRETNYPVPAQSQVYDYILFRGSDIKDIRVLTTTIPNDPAIVQLSVPPSLSESQFQSRTGYPAPPLVNMSSMPNAPGTSRSQSQTFQNSGFSGTSGSINITHSIPKPQNVQNVASEDESRSSTPSTQNAKNDAPARVSTGSIKDEQNSTQKRQNYTREKPQGANRYQQAPKPQYQQRYQQQSRYPQQQQQQQRYTQQQYQYRDYNRDNRDYNRDNRDYNRDNQYRNYNDYRDSCGPRQFVQPLRNTQRPDNWVNYGQRRNQNRMGQSGQPQNNYQSPGYQNLNRKPRNTLKFDADYDFEQANTEFEQMRTQLEKTKLEDSLKMNGDVECKKEDSGDEVVEENDVDGEDKPIFYDKVRSFFDQISYEAIERSKGHTQRMDWKTERKINSETFGSMALRRNSNFRGRPNGSAGYYNNYQGRNMSMGNNFRGGYRQQNNQRRQFSTPNKSHESGKENRAS